MILNNINFVNNFKNIEYICIEDIFDIAGLIDKGNEVKNIQGISIGTNYNFFGLFSLLHNSSISKVLDFIKKNNFNNLLINIPLLTPNLYEVLGVKWEKLQKEIIGMKKWNKIIFSINNVTQLKYVKDIFGNGHYINFNHFFYLIPSDPMFYFISKQKDKTVWNDELFVFYKSKVEKYGFKIEKIEQFKPLQGIDYSTEELVRNNIIFVGPKVIYSMTMRLFQLSKIKKTDISMLFDRETFNISDEEINKLFDLSIIKAEHLLGKYAFEKLKMFDDKKDKILEGNIKDTYIYYKNNYQYYDNLE